MPVLTVFAADRPAEPLRRISDPEAAATTLRSAGIGCELWEPIPALAPGVAPETVMAAYCERIAAVQRQGGYAAVDVVSIAPDDPDREVKRRKFLAEHTHIEDEVRFFAAGSGLFCLHLGDQVVQALCSAGDLLIVPDGTRHWFDMGPTPSFVAIRWFTNPAGWVAEPTGWADCARFPRYGD